MTTRERLFPSASGWIPDIIDGRPTYGRRHPGDIDARTGPVAYALARYSYDPNADRVGLQAAEAMGVAPEIVLKTLMAAVDGRPVCVVVPSNCEVSMKKLAATFGGKSAQMLKPPDAERLTGYRVGGISPLAQRRQVPTAVERTALDHPEVFINGGQRGLQVRLASARQFLTLHLAQ